MIINRLKSALLLLLVVVTASCGGSKQAKDSATTTAEPASRSYPPQNPGNEAPSDTINIVPPTSASAASGQPGSSSN